MNQRAYLGGRPKLLDIAKGAVETFVKVSCSFPSLKVLAVSFYSSLSSPPILECFGGIIFYFSGSCVMLDTYYGIVFPFLKLGRFTE